MHHGGDHGGRIPLLLPAPEGSAFDPLPTGGSTGSAQPTAKGFFSSFGQGEQPGSPSLGPSIFATPLKLAASLKAGVRGVAHDVSQ